MTVAKKQHRKQTSSASRLPPRDEARTKQPAEYSIRCVVGIDNAWELVPPPEALVRAEDLAEARAMIDAGEFEIATEELRWLLDSYHDLLDGHRMLGELALEEHDHKLGRAHFGYAFKLGLDALPAEDFQGTLPYSIAANQPFLESGKGLAWSLQELGKYDLAREVWRQLLRLDPTDPLGAGGMLARLDGPAGA